MIDKLYVYSANFVIDEERIYLSNFDIQIEEIKNSELPECVGYRSKKYDTIVVYKEEYGTPRFFNKLTKHGKDPIIVLVSVNKISFEQLTHEINYNCDLNILIRTQEKENGTQFLVIDKIMDDDALILQPESHSSVITLPRYIAEHVAFNENNFHDKFTHGSLDRVNHCIYDLKMEKEYHTLAKLENLEETLTLHNQKVMEDLYNGRND